MYSSRGQRMLLASLTLTQNQNAKEKKKQTEKWLLGINSCTAVPGNLNILTLHVTFATLIDIFVKSVHCTYLFAISLAVIHC